MLNLKIVEASVSIVPIGDSCTAASDDVSADMQKVNMIDSQDWSLTYLTGK